jgi:hypothetical protein
MATEPVPTGEVPGEAPIHKTNPALYSTDLARAVEGLPETAVLRRIGLGIRLACVLGAFSYGMWPHKEEIVFWVAAGAFLLGVSLPCVRQKQD